jgi:hypothetical protein
MLPSGVNIANTPKEIKYIFVIVFRMSEIADHDLA